jgi:hypothetical protein
MLSNSPWDGDPLHPELGGALVELVDDPLPVAGFIVVLPLVHIFGSSGKPWGE